jgi:hypothetical protein
VVGNASGGTGIYCITLAPSIDATTAQVIATANNGDDETDTVTAGNGILSHVEWDSTRPDCTGNQVEVRSWHYQQTSTTQDTLTVADEGFSFIVP